MDKVQADGEGKALGRLQALRDQGIDTGIWWYADHPTHFSGEASPSTAAKGEVYMAARARALAKAVRAIKDDSEAKRLQDEFFARSQH
jgi:creatinine amidohydrolase